MTLDTTKWYRHIHWTEGLGLQCRPLVSEPDRTGSIPVVLRDGRYYTVPAAHLTLIPERHTVELRVPQKGERYIYDGTVVTAFQDHTVTQWVIVEDEVTS